MSSVIYGALLATIASFLIFQGAQSVRDISEGLLVHFLIANAAILVLLGGLSSFREFALVESARASASEENAVLLEANAALAHAERQKAMRALSCAEAAAKARESFLASMSHELRTPLNAIIGFSQILEMGDKGIAINPEKQREYVTDIRHSGEHMLSLVTQILEYSRLESEGSDLHAETLSVTEITEAAMRMVGVLADKKQIPLLRQWDGRYKFEIETDERALSQILEVHDNGIGIPQEKIASVCDPFFQVDDQRSTGTDGTGLGLSIVTSLIRELGGEFEIESAVGEGTCCRVRLPLKIGGSISADLEEEEIERSVTSA